MNLGTQELIAALAVISLAGGIVINYVRTSEQGKMTEKELVKLDGTCSSCRKDMINHFADTRMHITDDFRAKVNDMYKSVKRIEGYIIKNAVIKEEEENG